MHLNGDAAVLPSPEEITNDAYEVIIRRNSNNDFEAIAPICPNLHNYVSRAKTKLCDGFLRTIERLLFLGLSKLRGLVSAFLIGVFCV